MNPIFFHVAPVYTSGSPAMVDEFTAHRVAKQEKAAYLRYLENPEMDPAMHVQALQGGLERIAYATQEKGGKIHIRDLITGVWWTVPTKEWGMGGSWYKRTDTDKYITNVGYDKVLP